MRKRTALALWFGVVVVEAGILCWPGLEAVRSPWSILMPAILLGATVILMRAEREPLRVLAAREPERDGA